MEFSSSCMSCAALVEAAILTTIRVVAECAEDPDYKTTGCIWPPSFDHHETLFIRKNIFQGIFG